MRFARLFSVLCVSLLAALCARAETAGQVLTAIGEAHALRDGRILQLYPGAPIESGDQVHTGADSYLQIRFTDWGLISLRPRTDFVVDEYVYEANKGGRQKAFFSLMNGGIRSVTGLIGHRDRGNYRLRTQTATVGIRGTHYGVLMCKQDCKNADGSPGPDGLYGGVVDGRIAVSPYGGRALEREFGAGEYFRLDSATSIPAPLFTAPPFFWDKREPLVRNGNRYFAGIPWGGSPGETPGPHDTTTTSGAIGGAIATVGSLLPPGVTLPTLPSPGPLPIASIVVPVVKPVVSIVGSVVAPAASSVGSTVGSVIPVVAPITPTVGSVTPVVTPITSTVGSTVGSVVNPVVAPVTSTVGSVVTPVVAPITFTVGSTVGSVVNPVVAPVAPVVAPVAPVIAPVVTPVVAPVAPVIAPVVTPVVAPVAPVIAPVVTPVVAPVAPVIAPVVTPIVAPVAPVIAPVVPVIAPVIAPSKPAVSLPSVPSLPVTSGLPSLLPKK